MVLIENNKAPIVENITPAIVIKFGLKSFKAKIAIKVIKIS
jgi:hypothetical protein